MTWIGTWSNQYGSTLTITDDAAGRLHGFFRTALRDSGFFGKDFAVAGVHHGDCLSFAFAGATPKGDMVCSFTGLLRAGKMQTMWHVAADAADDGAGKRAWPHAVMANADTFERVAA
ncbi:MAG: avidin/streptavidin family protein [Burkholderiaceae bacterium]